MPVTFVSELGGQDLLSYFHFWDLDLLFSRLLFNIKPISGTTFYLLHATEVFNSLPILSAKSSRFLDAGISSFDGGCRSVDHCVKALVTLRILRRVLKKTFSVLTLESKLLLCHLWVDFDKFFC